MTAFLRSRQPSSRQPRSTSPSSLGGDARPGSAIIIQDEEQNKGNSKSSGSWFWRNRERCFVAAGAFCFVVFLVNSLRAKSNVDSLPHRQDGAAEHETAIQTRTARSEKATARSAPMGSIIYGAKSKAGDTAKLVKAAIDAGFRHIATGGFHEEYNEAGVGVGWKESGVPRAELYLQTLFLAQGVKGYGAQNCRLEDEGACPPSPDLSIEDQVHLSLRSSLHNLQSDYIDSVLVHNFRATLQPYEETLRAWRALEGYVDRGVVRHLGIVSVHDKDYLVRLHDDARIKPAIIQNRFHTNRGYDVGLRPLFRQYAMANQLFWILTGSSLGRIRNNDAVKAIAEKQGVSLQVLLYSFTMEIGGSPLIGPKSIAHMTEDVEGLLTRRRKWEVEDLAVVANAINKQLIPPPTD